MQQKEDNVESTLYIFAAHLSQPDASFPAHRSPQKHSASHDNNEAASRGKAKWRAWLSGVIGKFGFFGLYRGSPFCDLRLLTNGHGAIRLPDE